MLATCPSARETILGSTGLHLRLKPTKPQMRTTCAAHWKKIRTEKKDSIFFGVPPAAARPPGVAGERRTRPDWMAHATTRWCCVVALLAVAVFLAYLPPAVSSSRAGAAAALQRVQMAAKDSAKVMQEKPDVTEGAEEDVSTTGLGEEEEREVPTGPDPIHHHSRGPRRHQSP